MKLRTTLLLLVLVTAAYFLIRRLGNPPQPEPTVWPLVAPEVLAEVEELELSLFSQEKVKLVRDVGGRFVMWFGRSREGVHFAYRDEVDADRLDHLFRAIEESTREFLDDRVDVDTRLKMNLDPPKYQLVLRGAGKETRVRLGRDDPSGQGVLGWIEGEERAFRTGGQVPNVLSFNAADLRSRKAISFDPQTVKAIELLTEPDSDEPQVLSLHQEATQEWWIDQPRRLRADPSRAAGVARQIATLPVVGFVADTFEVPGVREKTGLPDKPRYILSVRSSPGVQRQLFIGADLVTDQVSAMIPWRCEGQCLSIDRKDWEAILAGLALDALRYRRLTPVIHATAVALSESDLDGAVRWEFRRRGDHPKGEWNIRQPFEAVANAALGESTFPQVITDFDQLEITEFLDAAELVAAGAPFRPRYRLKVEWKADALILHKELEVEPREDSTLVRVLDLPDELYRVGKSLGEIAALDPRLYRDKTLLPTDDKFLEQITRFELRKGDQPRIVVTKKPGRNAPVAERDPDEESTTFQSECSGLRGATAFALRLPEAVENTGLAPADQPVQVIIVSDGVEHRLNIGKACDHGYYCTLTPGFPDLVLILSRSLVRGFLEMAEG